MVRYMPKQEKGAFLVPTEKLTSMVERAKQGDELAKSEIYATFEGYLARYFAKKIPAKTFQTGSRIPLHMSTGTSIK